MITNVSTRRGTNGALSARRALATARRVTRQLSHDRRTLALLLLLPVLLLVLLYYVFDADRQAFDSIGASLLGIFPMITMFLVRNIQPRLAACKALTCANAIV